MGAFGGHGLKSIEDQLGALVPPRWTGRSCAWRKSQFFAVRNGARKLSSKTAPTREMRTVRRSQSLRAGTSIGKVGTLDAGSLRVEGGATQEVNCVLEGKSVWEKWRRRSVAVIPTRAMRRRERNREVVARYQALAFSPSWAVSRRSCASRDRMAGIL